MKKGTFKISKKTVKGKTYYTATIIKSYRENEKVKDKDDEIIAHKVTKNR